MPATEQERIEAAALQQEAEDSRSGESDAMHRVIRATGSGWVEIRAEYLGHLLDMIEHNARYGGGG